MIIENSSSTGMLFVPFGFLGLGALWGGAKWLGGKATGLLFGGGDKETKIVYQTSPQMGTSVGFEQLPAGPINITQPVQQAGFGSLSITTILLLGFGIFLLLKK